jgi:NADPH-dependent 2,4-dienoyl-CoA reductase/sulfur reductase-like enzyme
MADVCSLHPFTEFPLAQALTGPRGWTRCPRRTAQFVAVVGSSAVGLAIADVLNQAGHFVTVFERGSRPAGQLRAWCIDHGLQDVDVDRYLMTLTGSGVVLRTNVTIGRDVPLDWLVDAYNAVVFATGEHLDVSCLRPGVFQTVGPAGGEPAAAIAIGCEIASAVNAYLR